ncbi:MAG: SUMF1/EgtB/PvdO family nonheme iron enzyme [Alphaproteobacteria bacterium]|nr:SUMF1/EgtB/PvdO family nonheme iron enzyme [Alphaproteobacteria bacterium]
MGSDLVGFRCARVQAGAEPADQRRVRQAEGRTAVDRLDGAQVLQPAADPPKIACPIPQAPSIIVRSDCERLTFRQVTQPDWASAIGRDRFGVWVEIEVPPDSGEPVTQRLRWIAPGRFTMGSPEEEPGRAEREGPQHLVTISRGFWLADTACSQALWQAVTGKKNPSAFKGDDRPVERVSWNDVQDFLRQLEELLPGCGADLPTEAEWEYACRAGTTTPFSFGDSVTREQVNHAASETVPVKSLPPNAWGLYEMHGNVWEWCADGRRAYDASPQVDPKGPEGEDTPRVLRGGSWIGEAGLARSAYRLAIPPGLASDYQGFRFCLRSIEPSQEPGRPGGPAGRAPGRRPAASPRDEAKPARKTRRRTRK